MGAECTTRSPQEETEPFASERAETVAARLSESAEVSARVSFRSIVVRRPTFRARARSWIVETYVRTVLTYRRKHAVGPMYLSCGIP